uniref:Alpha/beta hydrolase n=1 Tax=Macrostomum lignano TaxID=282301 RepID=A0A1I8IMD7_9PLAT
LNLTCSDQHAIRKLSTDAVPDNTYISPRSSERQLMLIGDPSSKVGITNEMRYWLSGSEFPVYPGLIHGVTLGAK